MSSSALKTGVDPLARRAALQGSRRGRYEAMVEIRLLEERVLALFGEGLIAGTTHTSQGQEAVSVALAAATRPTDTVVCTYRGHGTALALGVTQEAVLGEILGRSVGAMGGLGGSMHLSDPSVGLLPTVAIVGAGIPIAVGAALSAQVLGRDAVAVSVFGDGSTNIGAFHEGLNLASIWRLPVVFLCENNVYGEYSRIDRTTPIPDLATRAVSYAIPGVVVDGQDVDAAETAIGEAVYRARHGDGPTLIEAKTYRYSGHSRSDAGTYRPPGELDSWRERDPLKLFAARLVAEGELTEKDVASIEEDKQRQLEAVVETVLASPRPTVAQLFENVVANAGGAKRPAG
jgi:acetoin:2,6-dichlorophenolindophenol oxidoreductase subunit alpha